MKVFKKILNVFINILIVVVLVVSILIAVFALTSKASGVSTIFGFTIQTVQTDSMKGGSDEFEGGDFEKGDVIIGKATNSDENATYQVGDIVTYVGILSGTDAEGMITHRIIEVSTLRDDSDRIVYRTKGDNNYDADQEDGDTIYYIPAKDIKSVYYNKDFHGTTIKGLGGFLDFIQTQMGFFLVVLLPMIIFFLYEMIRVIFNAANYRNEKKKEQEDKEKEEEKQDTQAAIDAAVAEALRKRDEEEAQRNAAAADSPAPEAPAHDSSADFPTMTADEYEEFKKFQEFKKMQEKDT